MQISKYTLIVDDYPQKTESILYHARTQSIASIGQSTREVLKQMGNGKDYSDTFNPELEKELKELRRLGFLVKDEQEDQKRINDFFEQLKFSPNKYSFEATILTTYKCNFKCVYCFEESVKEAVVMDQETSQRVVDWLIRRAISRKYKSLYLVFYGGEPLLNNAPIDYIGQKMKSWADSQGIKFNFGMITNGSLIKPELVDRWIKFGLDNIRISIDGDRQAHDKNRPFIDGRGSFDLIINNIKQIIDKVSVSIAGNFDQSNLESIPRLLDYFDQEGLTKKFSEIGFAPLLPRLGSRGNPGKIELAECLSFFAKDGLFDATIWLTREFIKRGIETDLGLAINSCPLIMEDGAVSIDPKGIIYKCNSLLGYPEFSIGEVTKDQFNQQHTKMLNSDVWDKCAQDCPYVPICQGGCRFISYLENKDLTALCCKRSYLDRICPELIKLTYEREVSK